MEFLCESLNFTLFDLEQECRITFILLFNICHMYEYIYIKKKTFFKCTHFVSALCYC